MGLPIDQIPVKEFNQNRTVVGSDTMFRAEHQISGEDFQKKLEEKLKGRSSLEIQQEFQGYLRNQIQKHGKGFYNLPPKSAWIGSSADSAEEFLDYVSDKAIQVVGYYYPKSFKSHWGLRVGDMVYHADRCHKGSDNMCTFWVNLESFARDYINSPGGKRSNLWADHEIGSLSSLLSDKYKIAKYVHEYANFHTGLVGRYSDVSNNDHHFVQNLCSHIDTLKEMKCNINQLPKGFGLVLTNHKAFWCRGSTCGCGKTGRCWAKTWGSLWCYTNKAQTKKEARCSSNKDCSNGWECV